MQISHVPITTGTTLELNFRHDPRLPPPQPGPAGGLGPGAAVLPPAMQLHGGAGSSQPLLIRVYCSKVGCYLLFVHIRLRLIIMSSFLLIITIINPQKYQPQSPEAQGFSTSFSVQTLDQNPKERGSGQEKKEV